MPQRSAVCVCVHVAPAPVRSEAGRRRQRRPDLGRRPASWLKLKRRLRPSPRCCCAAAVCASSQGIFTWADAPLYLVGSVFGWAGTVWGDRISGLMSQRAFSRLLNGMVVVCAAFMVASALAPPRA